MYDNDVKDDADVAAELEERERSYSIAKIRSSIPGIKPEDIVVDEELRCLQCDTFIPVARQRIVLTISKTCDYCVQCQNDADKRDRIYG